MAADRLRKRGRLTARQREILEAIYSFVRLHHVPPTMLELGAHFGITTRQGLYSSLKAIEREGFITREFGKARAIVLRHTGTVVPLITCACGALILEGAPFHWKCSATAEVPFHHGWFLNVS